MARPSGVKETKPRNTPARKFAAEWTLRGLSPLDVLREAMEEEYDIWHDEDRPDGERAYAKMRCTAIADKAAPYTAAKLAATSVEITGKDGAPIRIEAIRRVIVDPRNTDA